MCKHVPLDKPEKAPNAKDWDGMTVETFKNQTLWTRGIHTFRNTKYFNKIYEIST